MARDADILDVVIGSRAIDTRSPFIGSEAATITATAREPWSAHLLEGRDPITSWPPPARLRTDWEPATVIKILPETPDTITLRLRKAGNQKFLPGQHFHLEVPTGALHPAVETYSAASSPWPCSRIIDITVKEVPGGQVSPVLVRRVPIGAVLGIDGPYGYFTWSEADGGPLALVGAGSGIVPLMAMIRYAVAKELQVPIRLLYSSRDRLHAIFYGELARLTELHPWLKVTHTFTADPIDSAARYHRRVDLHMIESVFDDVAGDCLAYVCGPFEMVTATESALETIGIKAGRLLSESWE